MGMFDSVFYICQNCKDIVEWQSKDGDCTLNTFYPPSVPIDIANGIDMQVQSCKCGKTYQIKRDDNLRTVSMRVDEV